MAKKTTSLLLLIGLIVPGVGYASSLTDYLPKSSDEQAIVTSLKENPDTWNNGDIKGWMALWHADAKIMYGRDRRIATKTEYGNMIPQRMAANPSYQFSTPEIAVSGNEALVKASMQIGSRATPIIINLIKQNDQWLFTSWKY